MCRPQGTKCWSCVVLKEADLACVLTRSRRSGAALLNLSPTRTNERLYNLMGDSLCEALAKLQLALADSTADRIEACLDCLLKALLLNNAEASEKMAEAQVLSQFPALLDPQASCSSKAANIIAEVTKNDSMRSSCVDAGLIPPLVRLLHCEDQEVLLQTGRALGNICYESQSLQAQLVSLGVIPTLVKLLSVQSHNAAVTEMCLAAFTSLAELESSKEQFASTDIAGELVKLLQKEVEHEKKEMILEVLTPLVENDRIKLQLVEAGLVECLLEMVDQTVDGELEEDAVELKTASDLIVQLLLGDESMQKLFEGGAGCVFQKVLSWVPSHSHQLQLAGALAVANFSRNDANCIHMVETGIVQKLLALLERHVVDGNVAVQHAALSAVRNLAIPVVNKSKMLSMGTADVVLKLLPSEMPVVQFKLLGALRMLIDTQAQASEQLGTNPALVQRLLEWCDAKDHAGVMGESNRLLSALIRHSKSKDVVRTIVQGGGVKHLVAMSTNEHVIMQNESLVALGVIAALDLGAAERDFERSGLVQVLHRLLSDERSAPEIQYNSMILVCSIMGSESLHGAVRNLAFLDLVAKLRAHENQTVARQASLTEQRLTVQG